MNPLVIAIDGPAAAGKGTLARRLAAHFGLRHLDTGALYRAVGRDVMLAGEDPADEARATARAATLDPTSLDDPDLRGEAAGHAASVVAAHPGVRAALLAFQRRFAATPPGAVLDGRDIGTVVCPDASVKLFVTASPEIRARRRHAESPEALDFAEILADIRRRDERDSRRSTAPLVAAADAFILDTSELDADQAFARALAIVAEHIPLDP